MCFIIPFGMIGAGGGTSNKSFLVCNLLIDIASGLIQRGSRISQCTPFMELQGLVGLRREVFGVPFHVGIDKGSFRRGVFLVHMTDEVDWRYGGGSNGGVILLINRRGIKVVDRDEKSFGRGCVANTFCGGKERLLGVSFNRRRRGRKNRNGPGTQMGNEVPHQLES